MYIFKKFRVLKIVQHEKNAQFKVVEKLINQMYLFLCPMCPMQRTAAHMYLGRTACMKDSYFMNTFPGIFRNVEALLEGYLYWLRHFAMENCLFKSINKNTSIH